ncbi:hypothetical protein SEA_CHILIPEPPER_35 [Microbacterium phage ChiliPepper]|nr:hypothetical protein SEA_CHILIPEPPER_35 [Microbacterium phage ChiliPepper]
MNENISTLPHTVTLPLVDRANQLAATVLEEKGDVYSPASILLDVVSTVSDNAGFEVQLRVTREGFQLVFPQGVETDEVLFNMDRGFEVIEEMTLEV